MRENDNHISSNNESDSEDNVDKYADMYSESDNNESHKSFDYLSKGKDKGKCTMKEDDIVTIKKIKNVCRGNGISMRENDNHISSNNESDSEDNVDKYADMYFESDNNESHKSFDYLSKCKDKRGKKFQTIDKFKECLTYYALANGFSLWFERDKTLCNWRCYGKMLKGESRFQVVSLVDEHTCVRNFNYGRLVNYKWIVRNFTDKIKMNLQITIDAIIDLVMKKYKGIVSRTQCRNAKTFASNKGDTAIQDHCDLHRSYANALAD
nr:hypothetical protein [Tanacetum cinerariifolium]